MTQKRKNPLGGGSSLQASGLSKTTDDILSKPKKMGKLDFMLWLFVNHQRFHRFQAEKVGDHCLPTTVSDLQKKHGVCFCRRSVKVPNHFGSETTVSEYWLEGTSLEKAESVCGIVSVGEKL